MSCICCLSSQSPCDCKLKSADACPAMSCFMLSSIAIKPTSDERAGSPASAVPAPFSRMALASSIPAKSFGTASKSLGTPSTCVRIAAMTCKRTDRSWLCCSRPASYFTSEPDTAASVLALASASSSRSSRNDRAFAGRPSVASFSRLFSSCAADAHCPAVVSPSPPRAGSGCCAATAVPTASTAERSWLTPCSSVERSCACLAASSEDERLLM
mmetsp:Transcript_60176/g.196592  ORF Transcript_60176/g.196592 Transcript_60176/m.196592 type:complete len:214 (+) Transcript_60176:1418-2059(+)